MKTRLENFSISQFVDLLCGRPDVLQAPHEVSNNANLAAAKRYDDERIIDNFTRGCPGQ